MHKRCVTCTYFHNAPDDLEAMFGGLTSLSSGYGAARADDGVCTLHDRYLSARAWCTDHVERATTKASQPAEPSPRVPFQEASPMACLYFS